MSMSEICGNQDFFIKRVACVLCVQSAEQQCCWSDVASLEQISCQALGIAAFPGSLSL